MTFEINLDRCHRCAACVLLEPRVFQVGGAGVTGRLSLGADVERRARVALLNCPATAIRHRDSPEREATPPDDPGLYGHFAGISETVRWHLGEIPWDRLRPDLASPSLRFLVREMAFSEYTTFSATHRFMQSFEDDVEFTQWLSIWFYEETRHPHALMEWLRILGALPENHEVLIRKARVSAPFMKSKTGTLVTNIISEVTAAAAYQAMADHGVEPTLRTVAQFIAGDEARHASSFFRFAQKRIEEADDPLRERLDALKVLHFWLSDTQQVTHPVSQMIARLDDPSSDVRVLKDVLFDPGTIRSRLIKMIGLLIEEPLHAIEEVLPLLRTMTADVQRRGGGEAPHG